MKKIIDKIGIIIIISVFLVFSIIIGANEKGVRYLPMLILLIIEIIYLTYRKIFLKDNLVLKNKVDLFVLLFFSCTLLPLIFKTYATFQGTIEFILKYFFTYSTYLCIRNTVKSKKDVEILVLAVLICSLVISFFTIDISNSFISRNIITKLNLLYNIRQKYYNGPFGYKNTLAIYYLFCLFLCFALNKLNSKKIIKVATIVYSAIILFIIYKSVSRIVYILTIISVFIYFIIVNKDRIRKNRKKIIKIGISIFATLLLCTTIFFLIFLKSSKPLTVNNKFNPIIKYDFKPNTEYELKFESNIEDLNVKLLERNRYFLEKELYIDNSSEQIDENLYLNRIKFKTNNYTFTMKLSFEDLDNEVTINKLYINDSEYILNYKYIPSKINSLISKFYLKDKGLYQRVDFWKDSIEISKDSLIIGQGGNTWKVRSYTVQDYPYISKETHSYFFELLISYGIVGIVLFFVIYILINVISIKTIKSNSEYNFKIPILIGFNVLLLHSCFFDFNMSFQLIQLIVFGFMAILIYDSKETINIKKYKNNIIDISLLLFLCSNLFILQNEAIAQNFGNLIEDKNKITLYNENYRLAHIQFISRSSDDYNYILDEIKNFINHEPYTCQNELYSLYWSTIINNLDKMNEDELYEHLQYMNNLYDNYSYNRKMYISQLFNRVNPMKQAYLEISSKHYNNQSINIELNRLKEIIIKEYHVNKPIIEDYDRSYISKKYSEKTMEEYNKIIEEIEKKSDELQ